MTTVKTYFRDFFCRSVAAMMFSLPVSLRSCFAFLDRRTGRYVSGMMISAGRVARARKVPNAKTHRQFDVSPMKPEIGGEKRGPVEVALMKHAMATPRLRWSLYTSAYRPGTMAIGPEATIPVNNRKPSSDPQLGATAQHILKMMKNTKVPRMMGFRPKCSLSGPHATGPMIYPIKKHEIGSTS